MKSGSESKPLFFKSAAEYRAWLEKNHDKATELWIGFWKKSTGRPTLTWQEVVDESLCFGWIDGIRKTVDADSYKQRVTPRRATSFWSAINLKRAGELASEGRMRPAGRKAFETRDRKKVYAFQQTKDGERLTPDEEAQIRKNRKAWAFYDAQPPGYKRMMARFLHTAKKDETRTKRLEILIKSSAAGKRLG